MSHPQPTESNKKRRRVSLTGSAAARMVLLDLRQRVIHRRDQASEVLVAPVIASTLVDWPR